MRWLPPGGSLHEREWRSRHRALLVLLWLHVPFLVGYQAIRPHGGHSGIVSRVGLSEVTLVVLLTLLATFGTTNGWPRRVTSTLVDRDLDAFDELAGGGMSREGRYLARRGATVWALLRASQIREHSDGSTAAFVVQLQDVTAEHLAREVLERRERQLEEAQQIARLGSWEWNRATGEHLFSDEIYRVFGVGPDNFEPSVDSIMSFVHPEDVEHLVGTVGRAVEEGASFTLEHRMVRADGEIRHVHTNGRVVADADGSTRLVGTLQDVTERRLEEQHRADLEHQLLQSQKLEAVGQLAGGVAHDFNNLLVAVSGATEMAADQVDRNSVAVRGHLATIKTAADRAASLTTQLLAFSRKQMLKPEILDVNDIVAESEGLLRRVLNANIALDFVYDRNIANVRVDVTQLSQVIMNLADNARDAMPDGGTFTVIVEDAHVDARVHDDRQPMESGPYVLLTVRDTGAGMTDEARERAFEPFFTTKPVGGGTGLGLATVYGIVKQSGGFVWLESEPGRGTTFSIYLPAVASPVSAGEAPGRRSSSRIEARVILAEDDDLVRGVIVSMLEESGAEVRAVASGAEALALCKEGDVDILVTDIAMPGLNGFDLAEAAARIDPTLRVLFISGYTFDEDRGLERHPEAFLRKPFTRDELIAALALSAPVAAHA